MRGDFDPHPIDRHVGQRIRARRKVLGMRRSDLADRLGITVHQVRKYEGGLNRLSASKLYEVAVILDMPLTALFEGLPPAASEPRRADNGPACAAKTEADAVSILFQRLPTPALRTAVLEVLRALARKG